jgi:hypothetical protein
MLDQTPTDLEILQDAVEIVIQLLDRSCLSVGMAIALHHLLVLLSIVLLLILVVDMGVLSMGDGGRFRRRRPLGGGSGRKGRVDGRGVVWAVLRSR